MDREGFRNRLKQYKKAREENPGLKYWEWKAQPAEKDIPKYDEGTDGVNEEDNSPRITVELPPEETSAERYQRIVAELGWTHQKLNEAKVKEANKYVIPYLPEKAIRLTTGRYNTGKISTNMLDSIYDAAQRTGVPFEEAIALAGRESTFGIGRGLHRNKGVSMTNLYSNWQQIVPNVIVESRRIKANAIWDKIRKGEQPTDDEFDHLSQYLLDNQYNIDNLKTIKEHPIDNALKYYKSGKYNPGDKSYNKKIQKEIELLMMDPAIKKWMKQKGIVSQFKDGGEVIDSRQNVLDRANKVASNYSDAKDFDLNPFMYAIRKFAKNTIGKGGISNCTLSATGWVDPNNQYMSARNIFDNPGSGYTEIDKAYALPGDLLISKNPKEGSYHTMLIEGFDGDTPLLRYSKGGHSTKKNLVTNKSLEEYHKLDSEQGGNHTEDHYFRYNFPNEFWLPEVVITPEKYADGGEVGDATQYGEPDDLLLPEVRQKVNKAKALRGEVNQFLDDWNSARFATGRFDSQLGNGLMESQKESRDSAPLFNSLSGYGAVSAFRKTPVAGVKGDTPEQFTTRFLENVKSTAAGMGHKIKTSLNTSTPIRGEFDQASHTIYYDRNSPFTKTHEQTHASGATPQENTVGEIIDQSGKYNNPYQDDKKEIYARLMQLREANDIDPTVVWDKKMLKEFKKNAQDFNILNRYDDDIILDLFNNVADAGNIQNEENKIFVAAEGGIIPKYDDGGEVGDPIENPVLPQSHDPYFTQWQADWLNHRRKQLYENLKESDGVIPLYSLASPSFFTKPEDKKRGDIRKDGWDREYIINDWSFLPLLKGASPDRVWLNKEFYRQLNNAATAPETVITSYGNTQGAYVTPSTWDNTGHYIVYSHKVNGPDGKTLRIHERTHASNAMPQEFKISEITNWGENRDKYHGYEYYLRDPGETYSRLMEYRHDNKLKPSQIIDLDYLNAHREQLKLYRLNMFTDDELLNMFNNVAENTVEENRTYKSKRA